MLGYFLAFFAGHVRICMYLLELVCIYYVTFLAFYPLSANGLGIRWLYFLYVYIRTIIGSVCYSRYRIYRVLLKCFYEHVSVMKLLVNYIL